MGRILERYPPLELNEAAGKIALKPIKSLGMDQGMTMVFAVQAPSALKVLKVGDKVMFQPERENRQLTVTKIEKRRFPPACGAPAFLLMALVKPNGSGPSQCTMTGAEPILRLRASGGGGVP
jgi:hypothetical protein